MWRAFQTAAAVSVSDVTSAGAPTVARWALTSDRTAPARSARAAGQSPPGVRSPAAGFEPAGVPRAVSAAATVASARGTNRRRGVRMWPPSEAARGGESPFRGLHAHVDRAGRRAVPEQRGDEPLQAPRREGGVARGELLLRPPPHVGDALVGQLLNSELGGRLERSRADEEVPLGLAGPAGHARPPARARPDQR